MIYYLLMFRRVIDVYCSSEIMMTLMIMMIMMMVMSYCAAAERAGKHTEQAGALRSEFSVLINSLTHSQ